MSLKKLGSIFYRKKIFLIIYTQPGILICFSKTLLTFCEQSGVFSQNSFLIYNHILTTRILDYVF